MLTFLFLNQTLRCDHSLESSRRDYFNDGHIIGFGWEMSKLSWKPFCSLFLNCSPDNYNFFKTDISQTTFWMKPFLANIHFSHNTSHIDEFIQYSYWENVTTALNCFTCPPPLWQGNTETEYSKCKTPYSITSVNPLESEIQNGHHKNPSESTWKSLFSAIFFQRSVVLVANRLEPRSGPTDVGSTLFATVQNTDALVSRLNWVKRPSKQEI